MNRRLYTGLFVCLVTALILVWMWNAGLLLRLAPANIPQSVIYTLDHPKGDVSEAQIKSALSYVKGVREVKIELDQGQFECQFDGKYISDVEIMAILLENQVKTFIAPENQKLRIENFSIEYQ